MARNERIGAAASPASLFLMKSCSGSSSGIPPIFVTKLIAAAPMSSSLRSANMYTVRGQVVRKSRVVSSPFLSRSSVRIVLAQGVFHPRLRKTAM